ncbi:hypothetical protein EYZ11_006458 [Aspergillus tanneri]|uniref:Nonribosomal peptide synthetases (NRPS) n=1 Tax=Aspergillus tanneri TaxID=1220188 RepID=A0A4S3JFE3_9EURO|nr:hypothetical protein EYZ11_006458 [Aspergillus tanneri]
MPRSNEPIAIVGSACRFAGNATSPSRLWELLRQPRDVLKKIDRFGADGHYHVDGHHHGASNVRHAYLLDEDPRGFDAPFFNIAASEADAIDPQQRLLLETVYESIESAGLRLEDLQGSATAVYVGTMTDDYAELSHYDPENIPTYAATGSARSILANRISYYFDWRGPSMSIDTACSSSLVAVHHAVQSLRAGESAMAVAAGSNLIFGPKMFIAESNLNMLSPNGRSRMWDADADGYARGEGLAAVVLKPLAEAVAAGDHIECIIRETGLNQDGRTPGITMPSSTAQTDLIRETYARAGLDLHTYSDRPQYFEAHGTGTKAGDPREAGAIFEAFCRDIDEAVDRGHPLYVGSIKTIVGHTEGTAGVAGLLKASLALQNKTIPPNMLFANLNPDIKPFYGRIQIPTEAKPWPILPAGVPRRASVNSFGFGGANAHAILESYEPEEYQPGRTRREAVIPLTFSAMSQRSLNAMLRTYSSFLAANPSIDMRTLSTSLFRRSALPIRITFPPAQNAKSLHEAIDACLEEKTTGTRAAAAKTRAVLGVFTGQGAQWPAMGRELIVVSPLARQILNRLENSLGGLPAADRPQWSLVEELMATADTSRVSEGTISQPLCTAVQVMLIDLLQSTGVQFEAVVGHSSGEIAAAYAAGFISARDAVRIAYYRGRYTTLAGGPQGQQGRMLAAGTSMEDAEELCQLPTFKGRLSVAACNSSASVTLSGDADAVEEARFILEDEQKFARVLKACHIEIQQPAPSAPKWYSSVRDGLLVDSQIAQDLASSYWNDNMLQPVLFSQALQAALGTTGPSLAIVLEIGPHPALKGPAGLTIQEAHGTDIPYSGVLSRGYNDLQAFASALGFIWTHLGPNVTDLSVFDKACHEQRLPSPLKGLPSYAWDHERQFWSESRASRINRTRTTPTHELLGVKLTDDREGEHTWRNYLKLAELPWLRGHQIQEQVLFPAAGYVVSGLEALRTLVPADEDARLFEAHEAVIHHALSIPDDASGVEIMIKLARVHTTQLDDSKTITAEFSFSACLNKETGTFTVMATGIVQAALGEPSLATLPQRPPPVANMTDLDVDYFYSSLWDLGYNYRDMFKGITSLHRTTDAACGTLQISGETNPPSTCLFHPSTLDVSFQTLFAAIGVPGRLWSLHVPLKLGRLRINPFACPDHAALGVNLSFDANLREFSISNGMYGDVDIYDQSGYPVLQLEGMHITPVSPASSQDDQEIFARTVWGGLEPDADEGFITPIPHDEVSAHSALLDLVALRYLKMLTKSVDIQALSDRWNEHQKNMWVWMKEVEERIALGQHPTCRPECLEPSEERIEVERSRVPHSQAIETVQSMGERLVQYMQCGDAKRDEPEPTSIHALHAFDAAMPGRSAYINQLAHVVGQMAHRYPHMNVLEVATGLEGVAEPIIENLSQLYLSYTVAGNVADPFPDTVGQPKPRALFRKPFNVQRDPLEQDFVEQSYDLVLVPNTLCATKSVSKSLHHIRRLVRPGGYIILLEPIGQPEFARQLVSAASRTIWAADDGMDGELDFPSLVRWDSLLRETGFSGVDTSTSIPLTLRTGFSLVVSQAVDSQISLLREPLTETDLSPFIDDLFILGGKTLKTLRLVKELREILAPFCRNVHVATGLETLERSIIPPRACVLSVLELDEPVFHNLTPIKLETCQALLDMTRTILWVTSGTEGEQPFANMMLAVSRCLAHEMPDLQWQSLDIGKEKPSARVLAEAMMRVYILGAWKVREADNMQRLWTFEREMAIVGGKIMVPRYTSHDDANYRFNSFKRVVRKEVAPTKSTVALVLDKEKSYDLHLCRQQPLPQGRYIQVEVVRSVLLAMKVGTAGDVYLIDGMDVKTQTRVLAFSPYQRSSILVPQAWTIPCPLPPDTDIMRLLLAMSNNLLSSWIVADVPPSNHILVHGATPELKSALLQLGKERGVQIMMTTSVHRADLGFVYLHPLAPDRDIKSSLPDNVSVFVDLSDDQQPSALGPRLDSCLDSSCVRKHVAQFVRPESFVSVETCIGEVAEYLKNSYTRALVEISQPDLYNSSEELALRTAIGQPMQLHHDARILNWQASVTVPVRLRCAAEDVHFRNDRTYFLVGMTGELGLSLTRWMVSRGARWFALSSRNPRVSPEWIEQMEAKGAVIKTFAMDVTNRESVLSTYQEICRSMPRIAGVTNAAMVIADGIFTNVSYMTMTQSIAPKVQGSLYLDELFRDSELDFFILFSSITSITGNVGQSSYAAANAFMTALAKARRSRGLVGSVMNLAGIFGLGYVTRAEKGVLDRLIALGFSNICEWDFHQNFAEAVIAGHPQSGRDPEVSAGLAKYDIDKEQDLPLWLQQPKFARYRLIRADGGSQNNSSSEAQVSVIAQLKEQTTKDGVRAVLIDGLLSMLRGTLHMAEEDAISPDSTIVELGVDSLVAVQMKSWFSNELDLDMPVLKLLGGATISDLVDDAVDRLSPSLIPSVDSDAVNNRAEASLDTQIVVSSSEDSTSTEDDTGSSGDSSQTSADDEDVEGLKDGHVGDSKFTYQRTAQMGYASTRFWFLQQYLNDRSTFNVVFKFTLTGRIREADAERAIKTVGERHEAFRTAFFAQGEMGEPTQGVRADSSLHLERKKITDASEVAREYDALTRYSFDLENGETARVLLLSLNPWKHFLIFCYHHIVMDGFSFNILLDELNKLYAGKLLPPVKLQFTDFVERQRAQVKGGVFDKDLQFWRDKLSKFPEVLPLFPVAKVTSRPPLMAYSFEEAVETLDSATASLIRDRSRRHKSTPFHFFLAVLKIFVFRFLDVENLCIGVADAGRGQLDTEGTIGLLLNVLPLRFEQGHADQSFGDAIAEARSTAYAAIQHSSLPFDVLLEELQIPRSSTHSPVFQIFMDYRQIAVQSPKMLGTKADATASPGRTAYDLILDVRDIAAGEMTVSFRGQQSLYSQTATRLLFESYMRLVRFFASNPSAIISTAPLFDQADIAAAIELGQGPTLTSSWPSTISERIEIVCHQSPSALAVKDGLQPPLTYGELAARVNAISASLISTGATQGSRVAVFQEPSSDWVPTMLAIWKIGSTYIPLELTNSLPRLAAIVKDSSPAVVVYHNKTATDVVSLTAETSTRTLNLADIVQLPDNVQTPSLANPDSPAVVLYTSGSTGTPKGIILKHSSIRNEIEGYSQQWGIGQETVLQQSAYSFDFSLDQMLSGLANGGTIFVVSKNDRRDPARIAELIFKEKITYTKATPSEYDSWIEHGSTSLAQATSWRFAFGGGEPLTNRTKGQFRSLGLLSLRLHNSYGPGEITISCTKGAVPYLNEEDYTERPVPLGKPLPNYALYIVDHNMEILPQGVSGEIVIAGLGPAAGYLNTEDATRSKFLPDVYSPARRMSEGWTTVYKSGDVGRLLPDGSFTFEKRVDGDTQVKIRGLRIELEDIESTIIKMASGQVSRAVCSVRGDPQFIVAHVQLIEAFPQGEELQYLRVLKNRLPLPQHMRPAVIVPVPQIPLNNHSKLDRLAAKKLPLLQESDREPSDDDLTGAELALKEVWVSVLPPDIACLGDVHSESTFFDLGGNSLLLVRLQAAIRQAFDVVMPLVTLLESSTLRDMAAAINEQSSVRTIDWGEETALPAGLSLSEPVPVDIESVKPSHPVTVLLTGATGFLGRHILQSLVDDERIGRIHCVAIRPLPGSDSLRQPVDSPKVVYHGGNLAATLLGLSQETFTELSGEVDAIIHSGANRAFWDYYQHLRGSNVSATKTIIQLAHKRQIPVHFISSGGICQWTGNNANNAESAASIKPPADGSMGYLATKWASEVCLENASKALNLPVYIHRVTTPNNPGDANVPTEVVEEFSRLALETKSIPISSNWRGTFDVIPVRPLAEEIRDTALQSVVSSPPDVSYVHHPSEFTVNMDSVRDYINSQVDDKTRATLEQVLPHKWAGRVKALGTKYQFASQDLTLGNAVSGDGEKGELQLRR